MMKKARTYEVFCGCTGIGIDVSKATLEVVGIEADEVWCAEISNKAEAIEELARTLSDAGYSHKQNHTYTVTHRKAGVRIDRALPSIAGSDICQLWFGFTDHQPAAVE